MRIRASVLVNDKKNNTYLQKARKRETKKRKISLKLKKPVEKKTKKRKESNKELQNSKEVKKEKILKVRAKGEHYFDRILLKHCTLNKLLRRIQEKRKDFRPITLLIQLPDVRIRDNQDVACLCDHDELEVQFADVDSENNDTITTSITTNNYNTKNNDSKDNNRNTNSSPKITKSSSTEIPKNGSSNTTQTSDHSGETVEGENGKNTVLEVETHNTKEDDQIIWSALEQQPPAIDSESFI